MGDLTGIFIMGFFILGTYKILELYARRKERMTIIEKFFDHCEKKNVSDFFQLPDMSFGKKDSSFWSLKIALLMIGAGTGCLLSLLIVSYLDYLGLDFYNDIKSLVVLSGTFAFGGAGLLISYFIESKQSKNK